METALSTQVIGHTEQRKRLALLWKKDKIPSALMFTGVSGIGKSLVAKELFRTLFCEKGDRYGGCGECKACRLFDVGNYPDFYVKDFSIKEDNTVESLRDLLHSLHLGAFSGKHRAILFHNAELISLQGANLLLKIIEEPRPDVHFCLLSSNPLRMPQTILSRCHNWFFDRLSDNEIKEIIARRGLAPHISAEDLLILADGSLENIDSLEQEYERWLTLKENLSKIIAGDVALAGSYAYELSKDRDNLRQDLRMAALYIRSLMQQDSSLTLSIALSNLLQAESLIFERNILPSYVLSFIFLDLANQQLAASKQMKGRLLSEVVL